MALDPLHEACWRFEQITPLIDLTITGAERRRRIEDLSRHGVTWPSGRVARIPASTMYRWLNAYRRTGCIESLLSRRERRGKRISDGAGRGPAIAPEWVEHALALVEEDPERSIFILSIGIRNRFNLPAPPPKSTLHRVLRADPRYRAARKRAQKKKTHTRRFQAGEPHQIWQCDAKGEFPVTFADGKKMMVRVLSIIDDMSRCVLRALIVIAESMATAVATFRQAAARWGLPDGFYADRGSPYDSYVFRRGSAVLGVRRIPTMPRSPQAHGKIEAYHRALKAWFVRELVRQVVLDLRHLQDLLDAVIDDLYNRTHKHREFNRPPSEVLAGRMSKRLVSAERLFEVFLYTRQYMLHKHARTVHVEGRTYRLPEDLQHLRTVPILVDPEKPHPPFIRLNSGLLIPLKPVLAIIEKPAEPARDRVEPIGSLTPLLERYRGRTLPLSNPGFGLPEIYQAFSQALGRRVPATEREASSVACWLGKHGPFQPQPFRCALEKTINRLGTGRALSQILDAMSALVERNIPEENQS